MKKLIVLVLLLQWVQSSAQLQQKNYVFTNVNLFNGVENKIFSNSAIYVKGGKIERIGKSGEAVSKEYEIIDCLGNYAIPGMMDVHTHIEGNDLKVPTAGNFIFDGVTTVVTGNCGGSNVNIAKYFQQLDSVKTSCYSLISH